MTQSKKRADSFDRENELLLTLTTKSKLDKMEIHETLMRAAGFIIGQPWYAVIVSKVQILKTRSKIVFSKREIWDTSTGAPVVLRGYWTEEGLKGSEKEGKILSIVNKGRQVLLTADCASSYHDVMCCEFKQKISIQ